jgi:uncharacterized membrane protein (UPF0127 family)
MAGPAILVAARLTTIPDKTTGGAMTSFLQPLLREGVAGRQLTNPRSGKIIADCLTTAFDSQSRRKGLLTRDSLPEGSALIIAPTNAIHTFFMKFPIDVAFVSRRGFVVKVRMAMPAWRVAAALRAYCVIELPAGSLLKSDTRVGDQCVISAPLRSDGDDTR